MITKQDILNMVKRVSLHTRSPQDDRLIKPEREWAMGLIILVAGLTIVSVYNTKNFLFYKDIEKNLPESQVMTPKYNTDGMAKVLEYYRIRKEEFDKWRGESNGSLETSSSSVMSDGDSIQSPVASGVLLGE